MAKTKRAAVDAAIKLKSQLSAPASANTKERAQAEADAWAERKRGWTNKASEKRSSILNDRAVEAGATSWSVVESAVRDRVIKLPKIPAWYKPRRGPKPSGE